MSRHLTANLADLADPPLSSALAEGDGFEVVLAGAAVTWRQVAPPARREENWVWELTGEGSPLRARATLQLFPEHRAACWQVELTNPGPDPVTLQAAWPLVLRFPGLNGPWRTLTLGGGTSENFYPPRAYRPRQRVVFGGQVQVESGDDGRSSSRHLPLLLATAGDQADAPGLFCGLEFTGRFFLALRRVGDSPYVRGGLRLADVVLPAGQTLALPPVHAGFFRGGLSAGTNALRRYVRDRVCPPPPDGAPALPAVAYSHWFGLGNDCDEVLLRRQADRAGELGCECFLLDAGWVPGGYPRGVGNWDRGDPGRFPSGLEGLADCVRRRGMGFGLGFEIEHAVEGTWAAREFPHLFLPPHDTRAGRSLHLNLARPDAADWALETISRWVHRLDLQWVRLDYHLQPDAFLLPADATGRMELDYCRGLYRFLDGLRARHPLLLVETSSGGGRRVDLGTLRRSHAVWISDQTFNPHICRYMQCRWNLLLPGRLGGSALAVPRGGTAGGFGDLDVLSRMCGRLSFAGDVAAWPAAYARRVRGRVEAYKSVRHLLAGDFHQLTPVPTSDEDLDAVQFSAPDGGEMVVLAFRMAGPGGRAVLRLRGIEPEAGYSVGAPARRTGGRKVRGAVLAGRGLSLRLGPQSARCLWVRREG